VGDSDEGEQITYGTNSPVADTGTGTLNLTAGTIDFTAATGLVVGLGSGAVGMMTQSGTSIVTGSNLVVGEDTGTGTYNLNGGSLTLSGSGVLGGLASSTGTLNQSAGTFTDNGGDFIVSSAGTGTYNLSGGTANFAAGILLGDTLGITGTLDQSGGNLTTGTHLLVGENGTGSYMLSGGTSSIGTTLILGDLANSAGTITQSAGTLTVTGLTTVGNNGTGTFITAGDDNFNGGLTVNNGTFTQDGGTVVIGAGHALTIAAANSSYTLGGTLQVGTFTATGGTGTFNFAGGTLQATGNLTDPLDGTLLGNSTISAPGGDTVILSGTLTGGGSLTVSSGTLQASTANLPGTSGVTIDSGATFNLTTSGNNTDTFSGTVSGAGTLETGNSGVTNSGATIATPSPYKLLIPTVNLTGGTTIAAATGLEVSNGTLNTINGGGGSTFEVGGTAGTVVVNGTATVPTVQVDNGSTLQIGNVVGSVTNNGTLMTPTPESTLIISVNLSQPIQGSVAQEGTLLVRTNGATSDSYTVGGSATLFGTIQVQGSGSNTYNIVTAGSLTTGTLNSATPGGLATSSTTLFITSLRDDPGAPTQILQLVTTQGTLSPFAQTPNQAAVAAAIDQVIQNPPANFAPLLTQIDALSAGQFSSLLNQLTPESYLYMRDIAFENSTFLAQKVDGFLDNLRRGYSGLDSSGLSFITPGMENSLGRTLLAYNNEGIAPNGVNYYPEDETSTPSSSDMLSEPGPANPAPATISDSTQPTMTPTVAPPAPTSVFNGHGSGFNEFVSGNVILGDMNQNGSNNDISKAHYIAGNATAGVSFRMSNNLAAGVLLDYNHTDAKTDSMGSHVRVDSYSPGLFATFFEKGFYANGLFTYGFNNYSNTRALGIGGLEATSSPSGQQYVGDLDFGYDFHPDRQWTVGPVVGIEYTHLDVDSFHESGAGPVDLTVDSQNAESLRGRIGAHVVYLVRSGSIVFQPNFTAAFQREFLDDSFDLTSQLDLPDTPAFTTQGTNSGRNSTLIGVGVTATFDNSMSAYLNYLAEIGADDYFVQSVEGGFKANF
jgi:uncharacterized protein with beta-barrel porin domain